MSIGSDILARINALTTAQKQDAVQLWDAIAAAFASFPPESPENSLRFSSVCSGGGGNLYTYWGISQPAYTIVSGDELIYDIYLYPTNPTFASTGGIELEFPGISGRFLGLADQNGHALHAPDLTAYAVGHWFTRRCSLAPAIGRILNTVDVVNESEVAGTIVTHYRRIQIVNGSTLKYNIWLLGFPTYNVDQYSNGYSAQELWGTYLGISMRRGASTFVGNSTSRTIAHALGRVPSFVGVTPSANPSGYLGEVWTTFDATNIYVYNSGSATTAFIWLVY